jgi:hypothetical protein
MRTDLDIEARLEAPKDHSLIGFEIFWLSRKAF